MYLTKLSGLTLDRGVAKVAKKLEIDFAEAIVHSFVQDDIDYVDWI